MPHYFMGITGIGTLTLRMIWAKEISPEYERAIPTRMKQTDLTIKSTTYNAAGLHANNARLAGGTLATGAAVPIRAMHVKDEILNSMQAQSRLVPLLADLLAWGAKTMPLAISNPSPSPGVSPGPFPISSVEAAPKWQVLPALFTLNNQNAGLPLTALGHILGIASTSRTQKLSRIGQQNQSK